MQCHENYIGVKEMNFMLEIDIFKIECGATGGPLMSWLDYIDFILSHLHSLVLRPRNLFICL